MDLDQVAETTLDKSQIEVQAEATKLEPSEDSLVVEKAPEFSVNSNIERAEISDFDEESSILDAHLHEQRIVDEESALATAETYIAAKCIPT